MTNTKLFQGSILMKVKYLLSVQREGTSNEDLWDENLKKSLIVGFGGGELQNQNVIKLFSIFSGV